MARTNRRKARARRAQLPRLPRVPRIRINLKAWLLPPLVFAIAAAATAGLGHLLDRPVERLVLEGSFERVTPIQIEAALVPALQSGLLSLDLGRLRARLEQLDWVESAELRREWPDTLVVRVIEHRAAARWGDTGLLDVHGKLFAQRSAHAFPELPELAGPMGSEHEVASFYLDLRRRLAAAELSLDTLSLDGRGAWHLKLKTGQEIRFGRRNLRQRVNRFFDVVRPALAAQFARVRYVDLRYTNGFAVGWRNGESGTDDGTRLAARREADAHG